MRAKFLVTAAPMALALMGGSAWASGGAPPPAPRQDVQAPVPSEPQAGSASASTAPQVVTAAPSSAIPGAAEPPASVGLAEVVVTAQRRSENLQKAAVAVDVVGGNDLIRNNITDPTAIGFLVPALTPTPGGFFLRGIGNFTVTPFADPALAFNYDGVYIGRPANTSGLFYDLQRVEVLKGPQGALYGRNATGGAINVIPETPKLGQNTGYITATGWWWRPTRSKTPAATSASTTP